MRYLIIALLFIPISGYTQNIKALDAKNGFRDMTFGDHASKFDDLVPIEYAKDSTTIYYTRSGDKLTIGAAEVTLHYGFYKNMFSSVSIRTEGYQNSRSLLDALTEMYGRGYQSNRYIKDYSWSGKKVSIAYDENSITNDASALIWSRVLWKMQSEDDKAKARNAKDDF